MDKNIVWQALHSEFKDFEDELQNVAAVKHGAIEIIITRNIKDFKKSELGVFSPRDYLETRIAKAIICFTVFTDLKANIKL